MKEYRRSIRRVCLILTVTLLTVLYTVPSAFADTAEMTPAAPELPAANEIPRTEAAQTEKVIETAVQKTNWYDSYVAFVTEQGWMSNLEDGTFGAEQPMTRAMFVSALYRMIHEPAEELRDLQEVGTISEKEAEDLAKSTEEDPEDTGSFKTERISAEELFADVTGDEWFVPALEWAAEQQIINGIDGKFYPDKTIDRETMAVMIRRAASALTITSPADWSISIDYTDLPEISEWAVDGIAFCAMYEIMSGNPDGSFAPKRELTRAEAAAVLQRIHFLRQPPVDIESRQPQ